MPLKPVPLKRKEVVAALGEPVSDRSEEQPEIIHEEEDSGSSDDDEEEE